MRINQRKAGVMLSYTSEAVKILSSLLYTPIMLRLLGQSEYGLYQLVHSVVAYLGLLSLGFTASYVRFYSKFKANEEDDKIPNLNGMFLTVFMIIAVIALVCGGLMTYNIEGVFKTGLTAEEYPKARILMALMTFNLAITFPNSVFSCITAAHEKFFFQRLLLLLNNLLNPFLTLPLLLMGYGSIAMVLVTTFIYISLLITNIWFVCFKMREKFVFKNFDFSLLKNIWSFTFFIFLNQIIDQINWSVDKFLLGRLAGTIAVAIYGLGAQINTMYLQLSTSISSVFVPQVNKIVAEEDDNHKLSQLFTRIGRMQFFVLGLIMTGFIFFGKPFMLFWGGEGYSESYYVALWLIIPVTVPLIQNIGIEIQRAKNKHRTRSVVYFFIAIANIFLSIPLIKWVGPTGAAIGTAISLTVGNILFMNWYYNYRIGLEIKNFWIGILKMLPALIIPVGVGVCIMLFVPIRKLIVLLALALVYAVIYVLSMWFFGLNASEKQMLSSTFGRVKNKFSKKKKKIEK